MGLPGCQKNFAALLGVRTVQKRAPTVTGVHCSAGSRNKLGDGIGQTFGCVQFKFKTLV